MLDDAGKIIMAKVFIDEENPQRPGGVLCDNSGMSGDEGFYQMHSNEADCMWLSGKNPDKQIEIIFDLQRNIQVSCMQIWNFNQPGATGSGLRKIKIYLSSDGKKWEELITEQYPFEFAGADGSAWIRATNLNDGFNSPVRFHGLTFRYLKISPNMLKNEGNWGDYYEGQNRFGLSAVRFFEYQPKVSYMSYIPSKAYTCDIGGESCNITNSLGMSDNNSPGAFLSSRSQDMWLSDQNPKSGDLIFDLGGTYPLSEMRVWNYNEFKNTDAGLKKIKIFYAVSHFDWKELKEKGYPYILKKASGKETTGPTDLEDGGVIDFNGAYARYVKISIDGSCGEGTWGHYDGFELRYGIGKVRFFAGKGDCMEPDYHFTGLLSNYNGWSGADGIFIAPANGNESQEPDENKKTIVIFSDTFYGESDPVSRRRKRFEILNNTSAEFFGNKPESINFRIKSDKNGKPGSLIDNPKSGEYFYWLQDCFIQNGKLYAFTDNIVFNESGMEGFQFDLVGVDLVSIKIEDESLDFDGVSVRSSPLYLKSPKTYFGCAILPNGFESKLPFADGYIYIYGLQDRGLLNKSLLVARVRAQDFEDFTKYTFYDGKEFVSDIKSAVPVCGEGGAEMSITPISSGPDKGKYLYIYTGSSVGSMIYSRVADTPFGPFGDKKLLYQISEPEKISLYGGKKIYTYNSKAHYHISDSDSLLISYNVNTMDFESHITNTEIYRPRFLRLGKIK